MSQKKQTFIGGAVVLTASALIVKLVGYIYTIPLMDDILHADGIGFYNVAYTLYNPIYSLAVAGFPGVIAKLTAQYIAAGRYRDLDRLRRVSRMLFLGIGVVGSLVMFLLARPYAQYIENPLVVYSIIALAPSLLFSCLMATRRGYNQGLRNMMPTAISQIVEVLVKLVFGLSGSYYILKTLNAEYAAYGTLFSRAVVNADAARINILAYAAMGAIAGVTVSVFAGWLFFVIRDRFVPAAYTGEQLSASPEAQNSRYYVKEILRLGIPISLSVMVGNITNLVDVTTIYKRLNEIVSTAPQVLLDSYHGVLDGKILEEIPNFLYGCYSGISIKLYNLIPTLTSTISISALPHISALWAGGDRSLLHDNQRSIIRFTAFIAAPIGFGLAALPGEISLLLFNKSLTEIAISASMTRVMGFAAVFAALVSPMFAMLNAIGRVDLPLKLTAATALFKIAYNYLMVSIPSLNIKATAFGSLICYVALFISAFYCICKNTGLKAYLWQDVGKTFVCAAACGVSAWLSSRVFSQFAGNSVSTALAIAVGGCVYIASAMLLRVLTRGDIEGLPKGEKIALLLEKMKVIR